MITHCRFGARSIVPRKRIQQRLMLLKRFLCHAGMEHQAKDMKMGVLVSERLTDKLVSRKLENTIVKHGILPGESRVTKTGILAGTVRHRACKFVKFSQPILIHRLGGAARTVGLKQQTHLVKVIEMAARDLGSRAVSDQVSLDDKPFSLKPAQRLTDRRVRYFQFTNEVVDGYARTWRNFERHQLSKNCLIDLVRQSGMTLNCPTPCAAIVDFRFRRIRTSHVYLLT